MYYYRHYGFFHFVWDIFMIFATCGLWLIWIFIRETQRRPIWMGYPYDEQIIMRKRYRG